MRSFWTGALAAAAGVLIGACATGSTETSPAALVEGNQADSGTSTQASSSDDSGTTSSDPTSEDSGATSPSAEDSGQASAPPTGMDSGTISPPQSDDSGVISEDSGEPQTDDAGGPAMGSSTCPDTLNYWGEWIAAPADATECTTGSDCPSTQCCYGANVGAGLCVAL